MALVFIPIENLQTKLYQREKEHKKFQNLSEEQLAEVAKKVYKKQENKGNAQSNESKLDRYYKTLQHLTNPYIHCDLKTYDERIAFLIMMTDPYLITYKEFLKLNLVSNEEIAKEEDEKEKRILLEKRKKALLDYEKTVREKIGFYDPRLIKYEEAFFNRVYSERELITEVENISPENLMFRAKLLKSFDNVSDERFEELKEIAQGWLSIVTEKPNSKTALFSVLNQKNLLGIKTVTEQLALYILLVDPELDMLSIFEEESKMQTVEDRITEEFGYFNKEMLILEKKFHKRFCPEKELSIWSKIK